MGNSYSSDQTTLHLSDIGADTLSRAGRARITSIQGKGIANSILKLHDAATAGAAETTAKETLKQSSNETSVTKTVYGGYDSYWAQYTFGEDGFVIGYEKIGRDLSIGKGLELIKDLGDATTVADQYGLNKFMGTHGIGHTRMATESDVDIKSAHPYWAFPYQDVAVVHNGQLTNYWGNRRILERSI